MEEKGSISQHRGEGKTVKLARRTKGIARRRETGEAEDGREVTPTRRGQAQHQREPTSRSRGEEPAISGPHTNCFYILTLRSVPLKCNTFSARHAA